VSFETAAGPRQRRLSPPRVPLYFTVSVSRLLLPEGPGSYNCIFQEPVGAVILTYTGVPCRRLLL
jgi:hypothetical protein